ncbi:hypothetical protein V1294_004251 [Bradyrhizobium sp. AZCC 1678]|uniref:hypothetical protein n=1 Tax=Bradyrhizobium sp. AZCC 1678 TaxID=3117030 RepID=UPI002FF3A69C
MAAEQAIAAHSAEQRLAARGVKTKGRPEAAFNADGSGLLKISLVEDQAWRGATAPLSSAPVAQVVRAGISSDVRPTFLHPDGNLLDQSVSTLKKRRERRPTFRSQSCAVASKISFGSRMHEASLQAR